MAKSVYRDDVVRLRSEGKTYRDICETLGCGMSIIGYHTKPFEREKDNNRSLEGRKNGRTYKSRGGTIYRNKEFVENYLKNHPCVDCGNTDIRVLEFDHVRGVKIEDVSVSVQQARSIKRLQEEIDKCDVRCANCHRIVTKERRIIKKPNN